MKLTEKEYIFIIGSPRSGTTWLQTMLGSLPDVATTLELTLFERYIAPLNNAWERDMRPIQEGKWDRGLPVLWSRDEFDDFLKSFLEQAYGSLLVKHPSATHILDKNPANSLYTDRIHYLIPHAKFIHIIRDGRDVATSLINARKNVGFGIETVREGAIIWLEYIQSAYKAQQIGNQNYLEVRYENLLSDPQKEMAKIFKFCDLSVSEDDVARIIEEHQFEKMKKERKTPDSEYRSPVGAYYKGKAGTWKSTFTALDRYEFHNIAGDLLIELNYAQDDWWYTNIFQKQWIMSYSFGTRIYQLLKRVILFLRKQFA